MRRFIAIVAVAVSSLVAQNASAGFGLLHRGACCDAAPSCGCEAPAPTCCEAPAPTCCEPAPCCKGGLLKGIFGKLHAKLHKPCCDAAPSCGCEAPAPSCGCEAPAPTCCEAPAAPSCGCEAPAPSCGCEAPAPTCCKPRHHHLMGLLSKLKAKKCCAAPTCCEAAPSCGCEVAAAPSCGCGS